MSKKINIWKNATKLDSRWEQLQTYLIQLEELDNLSEKNKIHTQATKLWNLIRKDMDSLQQNSQNIIRQCVEKETVTKTTISISPEKILEDIQDLSSDIKKDDINFACLQQYYTRLHTLQNHANKLNKKKGNIKTI